MVDFSVLYTASFCKINGIRRRSKSDIHEKCSSMSHRFFSTCASLIEVNTTDQGSLTKSTEYYLILLRTMPINFTV